MSKRILALLLCVVMIIPCCLLGLTGCSTLAYEGDLGAYITMYLTDDVYDFDPAKAYYNADTINVVSLLFDTLFTLDENGKVKKSMVADYEFYEDDRTGETCAEFELNELFWTNGSRISAADVVYAWTRLLAPENDFAAASLLYDIKNARAVKEGDLTKDNLGIEAISINRLKVTFEGKIDEDRFLLNLTSIATAPLLESYVSRNPDWAKKPSTMVTGGAYKIGKIFYKTDLDENELPTETYEDDNAIDENGSISTDRFAVKKINYFYLERNPYYYRDTQRDEIDDSVTNYRILVDCSKTAEELLQDYKDGKIFYMGNIPLSIRNDVLVRKEATVSNALSTFVLAMNQYAMVDDGANGTQLFADKNVRQALSMVIDRRAIARQVVFAEAATGLVAPGVFDAVKYDDRDFREEGGSVLATLPNKTEALNLLAAANVNPSDYSFTIKVAAYDDVHVAIVERIKNAWTELGFNVTVEKVQTIQNNDYSAEVEDTPKDVCDDLFVEALQRNNFEVIAYDYVSYSADAFSVLSSFAHTFSGMSIDHSDDINYEFAQLAPGMTGSVSVEYSVLMEAIYYVPYYATARKSASSTSYQQKLFTTRPYVDTAKALAQNVTKITNSTIASLEGLTSIDKLAIRKANINLAIDQLLTVKLDVERSFEVSGQTDTTTEAVAEAVALICEAQSEVTAANYSKDAVTAAIEKLTLAAEKLVSAADAAMAVAENANGATLHELIGKIYSDNGIKASEDVDDWTEQKSLLLHKAEELLMKELPVIPVVFNQNATLTHEDLSKVTSTYYIPGYFRKAELKDYETYVYTLDKVSKEDGSVVSSETRSIFDEFPIAKWDDIGKTIKEESLVK